MRYHDCGPRLTSCTGACNFDVQMAQKMRLSDPNRVAARDSKLWTREESRATRSNVRQVHCPCTLCCGATLLARNTVAQHLRRFKRHPRMRGLRNVSEYTVSSMQ